MRAMQIAILALVALVTVSTPARADEGDETVAKRVVVGARLGVFLPQLSSALGTHLTATLEGGYILPWIDGRLQAFGALSYTQPERSADGLPDGRLPEADSAYTFTTVQRELAFDAGFLLRFLPIETRFNAYFCTGLRVLWLQTETSGRAGDEKFGTNYEQSTKIGFTSGLGAEVILGPGRVMLQVSFGYSQLQHGLTGNVPTGALAASAGYRFVF